MGSGVSTLRAQLLFCACRWLPSTEVSLPGGLKCRGPEHRDTHRSRLAGKKASVRLLLMAARPGLPWVLPSRLSGPVLPCVWC